MKHRINYLIPFILAIGFLFQQTATAQTYDIPNSVVGNGGETMSSSNYSVTGTTLPAPAALDLSSASFTQRSGFWAVYQATVDVTSPATPTGLTATPGNGQVVLTWTANSESDLTSYKVYGGTSASPTTLLSTITAGTETYTHTSLTNGTTYYYRITAVDNAGNESGYSSEVSAMPLFGVTSFVPNSGIAGTGVTIYGVGFSTTASNNTVKFGNVSATVSSSTSSILKVSVPSGVVGPVSVSVSTGGVTDTSATLFTIIPTRTDMTTFGSQQAITTLADDVTSVYSADLDGDGDLDVLSASDYDDKIAWYENTDGSGTFGSQQVITTLADGAFSVYSADLDGDGDMDVLSASYNDDKIAWYENTDGSGTFGTQQVITTLADYPMSIHSADLDGDGDMDVLSASQFDTKIAWYENTDGSGTFGSQQVITTLADGAYSVHSADLDGDGDMDVLSASVFDDKIAWYENTDGSGSFGSQQVITTLADGAVSVYAADLDGDGDMDVLSASESDDKIAWYENTDGSGTFGSQQVITTLTDAARSVHTADLDGDGDLDVLSASYYDDKIAWYENTDGSGSFGSQQVITTLADVAFSVHSADLDGDGDLDVLSASRGDDKIAWYENMDAPPATPTNLTATPGNAQITLKWNKNIESDFAKYIIYGGTSASPTTKIDSTTSISDTTKTITGLTNGTTYYYRISAVDNAGNESGYSNEVSATPGQFTRITSGDIANDEADTRGIAWGDYDNDGDLDLFVTNYLGENNFLYQNNGDGTFTKITTGSVVTDGGNSFGVSWGDYDNDGDLDVLVANDGVNFLYSNNGDGTFSKITTDPVVTDDGTSISCAWGDYDNDGDLDLFVANSNSQNNFLYQNNGDGTFTKITTGSVVTDGGDSYGSSWSDYDGDGDLDLFVANVSGQNNFLYQNDGDGTFTKVTTGSIVTDGGYSFGSSWGDYDNDGDLDMFVTNGSAENNFLYSNNGNGTFTKVTTGNIVTDGGNSYGSSWGDYDNDGDLDLFVANSSGDNFLYSNNGNGTFTKVTTGPVVTDDGSSHSSAWSDYDNDGDLDLFVGNISSNLKNFLYANNGNTNEWVNITCIGTVSNTSAIGAKVHVKATIDGNAVWQMRDISGQTGYGSQNSLNAEFGLGDATVIDSIKIEWPSGIVWDTTNVAVNQFLSINESGDLPIRAPSGLVATSGNTQITLKWNKNNETDFAKYIIYGGISTNPTTKVDSTTSLSDTTKTITGLTNGTTYYYRITVVDNAGNESGYSSELSTVPWVSGGNSVSGVISSNQTWTEDGSPYIVTGNVLVNDGATLTIEAGVAVKFDMSLSLQINGELIAQGTNSNRIIFTSNQASPAAGDWNSIHFFDSATDATFEGSSYNSGSVFEYCDINYGGGDGSYGPVRLENAVPYFNNVSISQNNSDGVYGEVDSELKIINSSISNNQKSGIYIGGPIYIHNCNFINNLEKGINHASKSIDSNSLYISNSTITNNNSDGVFHHSQEESNNVTISITNSTISSNVGKGINNAGLHSPNSIFICINNIIEFNGQDGIYSSIGYYKSGSEITDNLINSNIGNGLTNSGSDPDISIKRNIITNNQGYGIYSPIYGSNGVTIDSNVVAMNDNSGIYASPYRKDLGESPHYLNSNIVYNNDGYGIYLENEGHADNNMVFRNQDYQIKINDNKSFTLTGNYLYSNKVLYNNNDISTPAVVAENNYWGTITDSEIQTKIYDWNDNGSLGIVDYSPYLSAPNINAPISPPANVLKQESGGNIVLTWDTNLESDLSGYKIYYGNFTGYSYSNSVDVGNVTTYTLTGVSIDSSISATAYDNNVDGTDDQVEGYESWFALADVAPEPPTNLVVDAAPTKIRLIWTASTSSDVSSYKIYRGTSANSTTVLTSVSSTTTSYDDTGLTNGTTYYYRMKAVKSSGLASAYTSDAFVKPMPTWHVSTSGSSSGFGSSSFPLSAIQAGIDSSSAGDTVLVYPGTYVENINFNGKNIVVGSLFLTTQDTSYISSTIIDGNQNGSVVTFESGEDSTAVLTGVTIINGFSQYGGGVYCNSAGPLLDYIFVTMNVSVDFGGGIFCNNSASPRIIDVTISENNSNMDGGGIYWQFGSTPILNRVKIVNNTATVRGGGIFCEGNSSSNLSNILIRDNNAQQGAGLWIHTINPVFNNIIIVNNTATESGGAIYSYMGEPTLINSVVRNNTPQQFYSYYLGGSVNALNSNIEGGWPGTGNIDSDPLFVDLANGDYLLADYSPCIGAGTDSVQITGTWYYAPTTDIDGNPRPNPAGSNPDMGAYENSRPSQRPKAGTIADGLTVDVDWHNSISFISANWLPFTDNDTLTYEYAIGTATSSLADILDWTPNGVDTSVTKTGLSLIEGLTYYISVRATDTDSQISDTTTTDGVNIDVTPPTISSVIEGSATTDSTVSDIDGNVYNTVTIGNQIWMKENLKTTHYQNGVEIPYLPNNDDWMNVSSGAYCVYDNNESNADTYGYLYSWYTVNDSNNAAPEGWHIPTDTEWTTLIDYLGGSNAAGSKLKESGTIHWNNPNTGSTNESGFTALPGGYRNHTNGSYSNIGSYGRFWSSTERNISDSWYRKLNYLNSEVYRDYYDKQRGLSIRCLKDNAVFTNGDADYQNSTDSLIVSWSGSDASSGLSNYEYALGTTSGGTETLGWTSTGTATADTVTGLTLTEGTTYYLSVRATDVAGNVSDVLTGDGIALDLTAPAGSIVHDGTTTDITFTGSDSTLSANWPAFTEDVSGIARYEVAIGSSSGGTEIVGWTNNTTDTIFTKTGLTLNSGTTYYVSVRATDLAWNVSTTITSDGVTVDTEGPIAGSVFDGDSSDMDWTNSDSSLSANWKNFSDPLSGINFYEYAIGTETDSFSLAGWTTTADTFFVESDLTLISSETYYVFVKATDYIGNTGNVSGSDGIMVDLIVPLVGELYDGADGDDIDWQSSDSTLSFYWSGSDSRELNYYQYSVGTAAGDSNVVDWTSVSTNTSVTIENLELIEEQTYYGNVRAVDRANNVSDVVSSDGITIDFTAPVTGIIIDGLEDDLVFTGTSDSLSAHWTGYSDSFSGIQFYEYAIGSTPQGSNVVDWTLNSTDTVMTKPGLSLMNGTMYYISVRATDFAGNVSNTGSTDGVTVDIEPPVAGNVFDGAADDEQWTNSFTTLEGNYSGFTDQISGLQFYEYAIGTTSGGTDVVDWMNNVLETSFFRDDFTLQSGTTYYISVRATDFVENTSTVATSNGITVDQFNPTVSEPLDGSLTEDIDWQQDNTMLMAAWQGNDTREIAYYEYSFGTTQGDSNIVDWTDNGTNTDVSISGLSLTNGTTYYINVRAYDMAGNRSDVAVSDGITIDYEPPSIGNVHDGAVGDTWLSNSSETVSVNWTGFTDSLSGIVQFEFALGSSPGSNDIIDWTDNGMDSTVIDYTGLNLQHAAYYYFSVRATDLVGNVSDVAASDGFVIDIYPGPPTLVSMTFDTSSELLSLIDDRVVDIVLSEPSISMEYEMTSIIPVIHTSELNNDSIQIHLTAPFAGLDTLKFSISNLTDMVGLDSSYSFTIYTKTHADYNDDGMVDVSDLATFTTAWTSEDFNNELGPVTGIVPHLIPTPNNVFDLRDIMTFARMWHWSNNTPTLMLANLYQYGNEPDIQQSGKMLEIVLPDNTLSAQILVLYDQTKLEIENSIDLLNKNEILLKSHFKEEGNLLIEKAYLSDNQEKRISLETNSLDKEDSYISIQYIFLDQYKNTVAQGFVSQKVIAVPDEYALHQNYPNPFNPVTTIQYDLPEDSRVNLIIYDILGREVKTLLNQPEQAGYKSVRWNGQNNAGQQTSAGMYFYRLETAGFIKVNKMLLLK